MPIFNPIQDLDPSDTYNPKKWNPMKTIQVIIQTPTADGRTDRLMDGRTDRGTNRVNPVYPPQLLCGGYNDNNLMVTEHLSFCHFVIQDKVSFICFYSFFLYQRLTRMWDNKNDSLLHNIYQILFQHKWATQLLLPSTNAKWMRGITHCKGIPHLNTMDNILQITIKSLT